MKRWEARQQPPGGWGKPPHMMACAEDSVIYTRCPSCGLTIESQRSRIEGCPQRPPLGPWEDELIGMVGAGHAGGASPASALPATQAPPAPIGTRSAADRKASSSDKLAIDAYRQGDRHMLIVTGELDLESAPSFEDTVVRVCDGGASELVLELSQLEFIDATGLNSVLSAKTLCAQRGCELLMTPRGRSARHALQLPRPRIGRRPFRRSTRLQRMES